MPIPDDIERVALLGWHVFPCSQYSRAMCFSGAHGVATYDLDTIAMWCKLYPGCNWSVAFGPSRLWGIDIDVPNEQHAHDGVAAFKEILSRHAPLPTCPMTKSGGGGNALFFAWNGEPIIGKSGVPAPGIDPRRGRLSVTIPPSIHISSRWPYRWLRAPWQVNAPVAPQWLLDLVKPPPEPEIKSAPVLTSGDKARAYAVAALRNAIGRVAQAAPGAANDTLNAEAHSMAKFIGAITESEIRDCLIAGARARNIPVREALATIESGIRSRRVRA